MLKKNFLCVVMLTCAYKKDVKQVLIISKTFKMRNYIIQYLSHNVLATKDVFLGGSCNPTTWRTDTVIPMLKELNISYHNFQVDEWKAELVDLENEAKKTSRVLLWVIGTSTRNTVSIIETAEFAATKRDRLVVVMSPYKKGQKIFNDTISDKEYYELMNALLILQYFMDQQKLPIFKSIPPSIEYISKILKGESKLPNSFISKDVIQYNDVNVTNNKEKLSAWDLFRQENILPPFSNIPDTDKRHLYFGVAGKDIDWLEKTAAPLLKSSGLDFYRPYTNNYNAQALPAEMQRITNSQIVLLVVSNRTRGIGIMTLGAHLIGTRKHQLVMCVQDIPAGGLVFGEKLSETAVKDYNRARTYFKDMARRGGVPVFNNLDDALNQAISLVSVTKKTK